MANPPPFLHIDMFGGLRVQRGEASFSRFRTRQTAALLAYLAYFPQPHGRESLIEKFWPDSPFDKGRNNLRVALYALRRQLEPTGIEPGSIFEANRQSMQLQRTFVTTDVQLFEEALKYAAQIPAEAEKHLSIALSLYKGPLLPGFYEDWIPLEESRLEDLFVEGMQRLLDIYQARQDEKKLRYWVHHAARVAPQSEQVQTWLAKFKIKTGKQHTKSRATAHKARNFPVADAALDTALPAVSNRFFGRENEIACVEEFFAAPQTRIITLLGSGGCGKTRLALELSHRLIAQNPPVPVIFVPLSDVTDPALLGDALLAALLPVSPAFFASDRTPGTSGNSDFGGVIQKLKQLPPCVLTLDNLEQLLPAGAALVQQLCDQVPGLRCLITSRKSLNLPDEQTVFIGPLSVPEADETNLLALYELPAVRLFVDRAQAQRPDFQITPHNAPALAALVRCLEGIPLALELCAAQSRVLTPNQILQQVVANQNKASHDNANTNHDDPVRLSARPNSVRATFEWSYQLLTPPLQAIWRALSVFRGGFSIEAASAVCHENLVLPALAFLRDAALVQSSEIVISPGQSEMRFSLLETARTFAAGLLTDDERPLIEELHATYYLELAEFIKASPNDSLPGWQGMFEREQDNFWAALQWACENHHQWAWHLAMALKEYWIAYQPARGHKAFATLTEKTNGGVLKIEPQAQTALLCAAGEFEMLVENLPSARELIENSLSRARATEDDAGQVRALSTLGLIALKEQQFAEAHRCFEQALVLASTQQEPTSIAWILRHRAAVWRAQGQLNEALADLTQALALFEEASDENGAAWVQLNIAGVHADQNDWFAARQSCDEALKFFRRQGHKTGLMWTLHQRGEIAFHLQETDARQLFIESLALARALDSNAAITLCRQALEKLP